MLALAVAGFIRRGALGACGLGLGLGLLAMSLIAHKEERFLLPIGAMLPLGLALGAGRVAALVAGEARRHVVVMTASLAVVLASSWSEWAARDWSPNAEWLMAMRWIGGRIVPVVTRPVEHGDVLELAGREWFVVHTPGHTGDHICLHDPESGTFLAGDHVLPSITPHISGLASSEDPLASYFYSLDRVAELAGVAQVLPAHGHPFTDLPARTEAIKRHHHERLEKLRAISRDFGGPASVAEFSRRLFQPRSWGAMAESETYAHLEHLRVARAAERREDADGRLLYRAD